MTRAPGILLAVVLLVAAVGSGLAAAGGNERQALAAATRATARFHELEHARAAGYTVLVQDLADHTCIAEPGVGAMGVHYLNPTLLDGSVSAAAPELLVYGRGGHERPRLVALEYLVFQAQWDATHAAPPSLFGREFDLTPSPNRYGLPAFYSLHAWIWEPNPSGMFSPWNPRVSCDS